MSDDLSWMTDATFEIPNPYRVRQRRVRRVFALLAVLFIIAGTLAALSH